MNQLKIYKSSAGSGKTFTLVKEYLLLVLRNPDEYKHILALTFTNKATEEMKSRIVDALVSLTNEIKGENSLFNLLQKELPEVNIKANALRVLDKILHDYSNFSISTIDSFFNRIIRSLAREIRLPLRLDIQMDADEVVTEISSRLFEGISRDKELSEWLTDFAFQKLREDKGWNIELEIQSIGRELLKENSLDGSVGSRQQVRNLLAELKNIKAGFEKQMKSFGEKGLKLISEMSLSIDDFSRKSSGPAGYFVKIIKRNADYSFNSYQATGLDSDEVWSTKASLMKDKITSLSAMSLRPLLRQASAYYEKEFPKYIGATEVLKRIFLLGIVEDLKKNLTKYRDENNLLLISDTPKMLSIVLSEDETPFVYEKSGNRYHHFLIDEFQDTSDLQWKNLLPLVINSLSSGNFSLVVGDVKQSIYRWRSGNMSLLDSEIKKHLHPFKSLITEEKLDTNYRSKKIIVDFNNLFFSLVPGIVNSDLRFDEQHLLHRSYSADAMQKTSEKNGIGGKVEIHAIEEKVAENADESPVALSWKENACLKLLDTIQDALTRGYSYADIAILVRSNTEGDEIATFLIANNITQVISPDSLLLSRSPEVRFLVSLFRFLNDQKNHIAAAEILYYYSIHSVENGTLDASPELHNIFSQVSSLQKARSKNNQQGTLFPDAELQNTFFSSLPQEFASHFRSFARLNVYELCEQLIRIFKITRNDAYILRFLDLILEFTQKQYSSIEAFLQWWDESVAARNASVVTSDNADAIRIMTIHKAKGLQFPVVIIPFANWSLKPKADEVLWLEGEEQPFNQFGKLPVAPVKNLLQSVFRKGYEEETLLTIIDNINLLYVAFTRAEDELYIFIKEQPSDNLNTTADLVRTVLGKAGYGNDLQLNKKFIIGENNLSSKKRKQVKSMFELKEHTGLDWHNKIRLSLKSEELLEILNQPLSKAINYGVLAHRVLSNIKSISDIDREIEKLKFEGLITVEEKEKLATEVSALLNIPAISVFFKDAGNVMAEREIILPDGEVLRPDRVLINADVATVIDFKTGKELPSHQKQINRYAEALLNMNFRTVEKYLIYISERRIVKVD